MIEALDRLRVDSFGVARLPVSSRLTWPSTVTTLDFSRARGCGPEGNQSRRKQGRHLPIVGSTSKERTSPLLCIGSRLRRGLIGLLLVVGAALTMPAAALAIDEFTIPSLASLPTGITAGPDGNVWFVEYNGNKVGRITPNGEVTEFTIPFAGGSSAPQEIVAGPDGALWFTAYGTNKIGRVTTDGTFDPPDGYSFSAQGGFYGPDGITVGPDGSGGRAIWFTQDGSDAIGKITLGGTVNFTNYPLDPSTQGYNPGDITTGPDGRLWFTEPEPNRVGALNPVDGSIVTFSKPGDPSAIVSSGASLWFTHSISNKIEQMSTTGGQVNVFPLSADSGPGGIVFGPDSALWFTESVSNKIGRLTTAGTLTEFPVPTPAGEGPDGITVGPDGALWFTEKGANKIGRIVPPASSGGGTPPPPPPPTTQQVTASVLSLGLSPSKFRAAPKGASISAAVGATVTYRLSAAGTTRFTVQRETVGRKKGKKCVPQTRRNRRAKKCKRYVAVKGSFTHAGKSGKNSFKFTARIANKKLRPGRYQLVASVPTSSAKPKRATFKIVRR
jgi:virginiamycin B lyase